MSIDWVRRSRDVKLRVRNFIGGRWLDVKGELLEKYSPRDGVLLSRFGTGEELEVDEAVRVAREAFEDGRWSALGTQSRKDVLHKFAALIEAHSEELALLESLDVGKPIRDALTFDVPHAAGIIRYNAEAADKLYGKVYGVDQSSLSYQLRRPVGVIAGIVGWNFPLVLAASKVGPSLAAGNCVVLKPSELSSFSAGRMAEIAVEAGVPPGVFNVVHGGPNAGSVLARHPEVDLVTFTGSSRTGKQLLVAAGQTNMKRLLLECGGKAPNIVFDDSPSLEAVAEAVVARAFWNQGQVCTASSRLLIQEGRREELLEALISKASALHPGDPLDPSTRFGALISAGHRQKVLSYIQLGEQEGARIVYRCRSPKPHPEGFYVSPVIFDDVSSRHRIAQEEIFGPVLSIISFRDESEAVEIANDTIYGLSAVLWTRDLSRAHRVTHGIKAGWITVNATGKPKGGLGAGALSAGGHKESGIGTEGGMEGLEAYTSKSAVQIFL